MCISDENNCKVKSPEHEEFINVELLHISRQKFSAFIAACKMKGVSAHVVIEDFLSEYIMTVFGKNINYSDICKDHEDRIEEY